MFSLTVPNDYNQQQQKLVAPTDGQLGYQPPQQPFHHSQQSQNLPKLTPHDIQQSQIPPNQLNHHQQLQQFNPNMREHFQHGRRQQVLIGQQHYQG